jgi:uncharacterized damage-inducible protein DinB
MNPLRAYEYLKLSRARLFDWIRPLSQGDYTRLFPFGLHTIRATMTEIAPGEWAFARRLREEPLSPWEEWPFREERLPTFKDLEAACRTLSEQTLQNFRSVEDWNRVMVFRAQEGDDTMTVAPTAGDIALNLCFHEVHHRAQVMTILRLLGVSAQDLDYRLLMYPQLS